jgi:hypothetical protein
MRGLLAHALLLCCCANASASAARSNDNIAVDWYAGYVSESARLRAMDEAGLRVLVDRPMDVAAWQRSLLLAEVYARGLPVSKHLPLLAAAYADRLSMDPLWAATLAASWIREMPQGWTVSQSVDYAAVRGWPISTPVDTLVRLTQRRAR